MTFRKEIIGECELYCGDALSVLRTLPDEFVHCVVTSPPYWGLRDYGTGRWEGGDPECGHVASEFGKGRGSGKWFDGGTPREVPQGRPQTGPVCGKCGARRIDEQMGLEPTLGEHIAAMVAVFREVRRVLRKDGTCWLNYGDCYATAPNGRSAADTKAAGNDDRTFRDKPFSTVGPVYVSDAEKGDRRGKSGNKQLTSGGMKGHTGRIVAGGVLKPKDLCMIPNRLAIALQDDGWWVRSEIIWAKPNPMPESIKDRPAVAHEKIWLLTKSARYFYDAEAVRTAAKSNGDYKMPDGWDPGPGAHGSFHRKGREKGRKSDKQRGHGRRHAGFNDRCHAKEAVGDVPGTANLRNVWTIPTRGYREAHFATFPTEIPERCIKAGCPKGGVVLDPFGGAGTVGLVASRLQRKSVLIELNPTYIEMIRERIKAELGMFALVSSSPEPQEPKQQVMDGL